MNFTPQSIVTFANKDLKYLYAGGAVLDAYYNTRFSGDVDIFVPDNENIDKTFTVADGYVATDLPPMECYRHTMRAVSRVVKIKEKNTGKHVLDIVFMYMPNSNFTMEDFHAVLVDRFDIPLCALAWDGDKLYFPPRGLANLETKTSVIRIRQNKNSHTDMQRVMARMTKYLQRGVSLNPVLTDH